MRSPGDQPLTELPTCEMTPLASWPMMIGGRRRPVLPSMPWTSLPQMPQAFTEIRTSSGVGAGAGTSSQENFLYSLRMRAFMGEYSVFSFQYSVFGNQVNTWSPAVPGRD